MKFSKLRQLLLVSAIGLIVATLFSRLPARDHRLRLCRHLRSRSEGGCPGEIETYAVRLAVRRHAHRRSRQVYSGGTTPTAMAVSPGLSESLRRQPGDKNIVSTSPVAGNGVLTKKDTVTACHNACGHGGQSRRQHISTSFPEPHRPRYRHIRSSSGAIGSVASSSSASRSQASPPIPSCPPASPSSPSGNAVLSPHTT